MPVTDSTTFQPEAAPEAPTNFGDPKSKIKSEQPWVYINSAPPPLTIKTVSYIALRVDLPTVAYTVIYQRDDIPADLKQRVQSIADRCSSFLNGFLGTLGAPKNVNASNFGNLLDHVKKPVLSENTTSGRPGMTQGGQIYVLSNRNNWGQACDFAILSFLMLLYCRMISDAKNRCQACDFAILSSLLFQLQPTANPAP